MIRQTERAKYPLEKRVKGGVKVRSFHPDRGYSGWTFIPDPKCFTCGDKGVVYDRDAEPDNPWSGATKPCPRGCKEEQ